MHLADLDSVLRFIDDWADCGGFDYQP
jgi:hypothetical protein